MTSIFSDLAYVIAEHWTVWLVTVVLIVGSVIDAIELRVPNWLTFPFIISGWVYGAAAFGWEGLFWSLLGTGVAMACLLPMYAIGGMGAGDVKLLAGVGAWLTIQHTVWGFVVGVFIGAAMAIVMALVSGQWSHHYRQFFTIFKEIVTIRDPERLSEIAAERKPRMRLLPYGVPIATGCICYYIAMGLLV
jgi:prepilin peptidase CpaA